MNIEDFTPAQRKKAFDYHLGCESYYRAQALFLEDRLKKAEEGGYDKEGNPWHKEYLKIKAQWSKFLDQAEDERKRAEELSPRESSLKRPENL